MEDSELIRTIRAHEDRAVTASDVADEVDIKRAATLQRLDKLHEEGKVEKKRVGSRAVVWWAP